MLDADLPSFRNPPVVETVLGVQFSPISGLSNAHLGAFWKFLSSEGFANEEWNSVSDAPALAPSFERFDDETTWEHGLSFRLDKDVSTRIQIHNRRRDAMIQAQNGRLHFNWIRRESADYPRFSSVQPRLFELLKLFRSFVAYEGLDSVSMNQWEVTYVNHIPKGTVWDRPSDWAALFRGQPGIAALDTSVLLEGVSAALRYEIPEKKGRLHVDLKHARLRDPGSNEILRLTLTARGPLVDNGDDAALANGLELGHRTIVQFFKEFTSSDAHQFWEISE